MSQRSAAEELFDDLAEEARRREAAQRQRQVVGGLLSNPSPDQVARNSRVSREVGRPIVPGQEDEAESLLRVQRFADLMGGSSALARWAEQNPRGAAAAQDDAESLGIISGAWDFLKKLPSRAAGEGSLRLGGWVTDLYNTFEEATDFAMTPVHAAMGAVSQATGIESLDPSDVLRDRQRRREQRSSWFLEQAEEVAERNRGRNWITEGLLAGTSSIPATAAAIATRDPRAATAVLGTLSGAGSYAEARRQGVDAGRALRYGVTQGAIEGVTERIPAGTLVDLVARKTPWGRAFVRELGQEMTGEQVATVLQDMNDWAFLPENASKTLGDYLRERPQAALDTALAVAGGSSVTVAGIGAAQRATEVALRIEERVDQSRRAHREGEFLDKLQRGLEGSKLKGRDGEALRDYLRREAAEAGAEYAFIPAEPNDEYIRHAEAFA